MIRIGFSSRLRIAGISVASFRAPRPSAKVPVGAISANQRSTTPTLSTPAGPQRKITLATRSLEPKFIVESDARTRPANFAYILGGTGPFDGILVGAGLSGVGRRLGCDGLSEKTFAILEAAR